MPISVAARSKAWDSGRSPAQIVGSNPTGGVDVCLFVCCECYVLWGRGLLRRADHSPRGILPIVARHKKNA